MTAQEIQNLMVANFANFSLSALEHYHNECEKMIANMIAVDPAVFDIMDRLDKEMQNRG